MPAEVPRHPGVVVAELSEGGAGGQTVPGGGGGDGGQTVLPDGEGKK